MKVGVIVVLLLLLPRLPASLTDCAATPVPGLCWNAAADEYRLAGSFAVVDIAADAVTRLTAGGLRVAAGQHLAVTGAIHATRLPSILYVRGAVVVEAGAQLYLSDTALYAARGGGIALGDGSAVTMSLASTMLVETPGCATIGRDVNLTFAATVAGIAAAGEVVVFGSHNDVDELCLTGVFARVVVQYIDAQGNQTPASYGCSSPSAFAVVFGTADCSGNRIPLPPAPTQRVLPAPLPIGSESIPSPLVTPATDARSGKPLAWEFWLMFIVAVAIMVAFVGTMVGMFVFRRHVTPFAVGEGGNASSLIV